MKRELVFLLLLLVSFSSVSAASIEMPSEIDRGETVIAKLSGNFLSNVAEENVFLYREHIRVPFEVSVDKLDGIYYIYFQTTKESAGNYSLRIKDIEYYKTLGETTKEDLMQNFSISEEIADFSVEPGFLITNEETYVLNIQNLQDTDLTIGVGEILSIEEGKDEGESLFDRLFGSSDTNETGSNEAEGTPIYSQGSVTLLAGETKSLEFSNEGISQTLKKASISTSRTSYEVPVFVQGNFSSELDSAELKFNILEVIMPLYKNSSEKVVANLTNIGNAISEDVSIMVSSEISPFVEVSFNQIDSLNPSETLQLELVFSSNEIIEDQIIGEIFAEDSEGNEDSIEIQINFLEEGDEEPEISKDEPFSRKTCEDLGGGKCEDGTVCSQNLTQAEDTLQCCLGECEKEETSSSGKIIGWTIIIAIVILFLWFFLTRYRGAKSSPTNLDKAKLRK